LDEPHGEAQSLAEVDDWLYKKAMRTVLRRRCRTARR
jgi:hypothetical protein